MPSTTASGPVKVSEILGFEAFGLLLKNRSYLVFMIASTLICIPLAFYYQITSRIVEMTGLPIGRAALSIPCSRTSGSPGSSSSR